MRKNKADRHMLIPEVRFVVRARQLAAAAMVVAVAGCGTDDEPSRPLTDPIEGFIGAVVADEPQAALIGRDILSIGGSAADAAVATYFAMAVTLPSQASLGGGGVCLAFDQPTGDVRTIEFLARAPAQVAADADRPTAVPGNVRGFYTLHARSGRLPWSQIVAPAERLARFGAQVSRALAADLEPVRAALAADAEVGRVFRRPDGRGIVGEGDVVTQLDLAGVLSRLRSDGPASFYTGPNAIELVRSVRAAGGSLDVGDLYDYRPATIEPSSLELGRDVLYAAPPPPEGGAIAAGMLAMLDHRDLYRSADADQRPHLLAETAARAHAGPVGPRDPGRIAEMLAGYAPDRRDDALFRRLPTTGPENPAAASVVAADRQGNAVACSVSLNSLFGSGRIAAGTGIFLAALPDAGGRGAARLTPMLVINRNIDAFRFAGAASGGIAAPTALAQVAARVLLAGQGLTAAVAAPRIHAGGAGERVFVEADLPAPAMAALGRRGHVLAVTPSLGRVDAVVCTGGLPRNPETCSAGSDPRGFGLALLGG
jgi:gamma-glutamyltranspeptidase/glutathione hydrolase